MIIEVDHLTKSFGGNIAVNDVSLQVQPHQITTIIGPNGSGKSTLFNLLCGLLDVDRGSICLGDLDITRFPDFEVSRAGVARTFQEVRVFSYLTVREHFDVVYVSSNEHLIFGLNRKKHDHDDIYLEVLKKLGINISLDTLGMDLSYGQSKLLNLAMSFLSPHQVLLLDEPVAGVNPALRKQIEKILIDLRGQSETILLIEHDMNFVTEVSDWIIVMDAGKVITQGTVDEILDNEEVLKAYLGR